MARSRSAGVNGVGEPTIEPFDPASEPGTAIGGDEPYGWVFTWSLEEEPTDLSD